MVKHIVCLMSYLKLKTQPRVYTGVYRMVDASSNHFIYFIRSTISDNTCLSAVTCMPINHLPVRKAYSLDENRLTNT